LRSEIWRTAQLGFDPTKDTTTQADLDINDARPERRSLHDFCCDLAPGLLNRARNLISEGISRSLVRLNRA
jgi:hypothetical protein